MVTVSQIVPPVIPAPREEIEFFDEFGRYLGVAPREEVHEKGLWHQVFHLLVLANRPLGPSVVLQRRAAQKTVFPNKIDLSATGHLRAGESPLDGVREAKEELGATFAASQLYPIGVRRVSDETPEGINREFCHTFLVRDDRPLASYNPDPTEVAAVIEAPLAGLHELLLGSRPNLEALEHDETQTERSVQLDATEFVPDDLAQLPAGVISMNHWVSVLSSALGLWSQLKTDL